MLVQSYFGDEWDRRSFAVARAPVPSYVKGSIAFTGSGNNIATFALPPDTETRHFRYSLKDKRLEDTGGDVILRANNVGQWPSWVVPFLQGYPYGSTGGRSNAGFEIMPTGDRAKFLSTSCPSYAQVIPNRGHGGVTDYTYLDGWLPSLLEVPLTNQILCVLNEDNTQIHQLRIADMGSVYANDNGLFVFEARPYQASTGRRAFGCNDGYCTPEAEVVTEYTYNNSEGPLIAKTLEYAKTTRLCMDSALGFTLPAPLRIHVYGELETRTTAETWNFGNAAREITVVGYQGHLWAGEIRIWDVNQIYSETHEPTHVYTYWAFPNITNMGSITSGFPNWLAEGLAIALGKNLTCNPSHQRMGDWYRYNPGDKEPHALGSELFKQLSNNANGKPKFNCQLVCEENIFKDLVAHYATQTSISTAEIKASIKRVIPNHDADIDALFTNLGIN